MRYNKFRCVLLIDDNDIDNFTNKKKIEQCNFAGQIHLAKNANDGISLLKQLEKTPHLLPEIIFLDIKMPEVDGFGFLKLFESLSDAVKSKCNIIMLTSSIDSIDYNRALSNPFVINYLKKPLNIEELMMIAA